MDNKKLVATERKKFKDLKSLYEDKNQVKKYWNKTGAHRLSDREFGKVKNQLLYDNSWQTTIDALIKFGGINNGDKILEVGCGWGRILVGLKKYFPKSQLVGMDITKELLQRADSVIKKETGSIKNVKLITGDIDKLTFKKNTFDKAIAIRVLQYVPNPQNSLAELKRVVKENGQVIIAVPNKFNPIYLLRYHTKLYKPSAVKKWFETAGFSEIKIKTIRFVPFAHHFKANSKIMILEKIGQSIPLIKWIGGVIIITGKKKI